MATQQGFLYEENVAKALKKLGWVQSGYSPAGASSNRADLDLFIKGKTHGCELKKDLASAGSLVIHHLGNKRYQLGAHDNHIEKLFLYDIAMKLNVIQIITSKWLKEPFIQKVRDEKWKKRVKELNMGLKERYDYDISTFKDIYFPLPNTTISSYYNLKDTFYLNVATHGFYLLGASDPAKLNKNLLKKIPNWNDKHTAVLRIRIQSKGVTKAAEQELRTGKIDGAQGYQITMEIQFKTVTKSPFNIGPIVGKTATIDTNKIILP